MEAGSSVFKAIDSIVDASFSSSIAGSEAIDCMYHCCSHKKERPLSILRLGTEHLVSWLQGGPTMLPSSLGSLELPSHMQSSMVHLRRQTLKADNKRRSESLLKPLLSSLCSPDTRRALAGSASLVTCHRG